MPEEQLTNQSADNLEQQNRQSEAEKRIKQLSEKVRLTAEERDEKDRLLKEQSEKVATLEKENAFHSGFSDMLGSYPAARDHKEDIRNKVLAGYTVEDATLAVLGKAGKLATAEPASPQVAGGSADTVMTTAQKDPKEMTQAERRAELEKQLMWQ